MQDSLCRPRPASIGETLEILGHALPAAIAAFQPDAPRLLRVELPLLAVEPVQWLRAQTAPSRYFWHDRAGEFTTAGVGEADIIEPDGPADLEALFGQMRARLAEDAPGLRYYGGFRFQEGRRKGERWRKFKAYRFIVPRFEVQARGEGCFFAVNLIIGPDTDKDAIADQVLDELSQVQACSAPRPSAIPPVHDRVDMPDIAAWRGLIAHALESIASGALEKVVLARETSFLADSNFDPVDVAAQLHDQAFGAYVFCFQPAPHRAFLGASPERLYKREGTRLLSEALAGTRPRGASEAQDAALADALLRSEKDQREHDIVVRMLEEHLAPLCAGVNHAAHPAIMPLRNCQHLHTPFDAELRDAESDAALLRTLHPTPAVGGVPRAAALAWLDAHEPFDRGIYAAPVGWVGLHGAEFSVAIRSAIVRENTLALYAGAGIVAGSSADEEWAEINQKMKSLLAILTEDNTE